MNIRRIEKISKLIISDKALDIMELDAKFYSFLSDKNLKSNFKFRYKHLTKVLFAEYFF